MFRKLFYICVTICQVQYLVHGEISKSSLTFVIDDTGSMYDEISQVKEKTKLLFDAVLQSNASKIDDFIIVTFNDPDAKVRTITRDQNEFRRALDDIQVGGGGDCPEYAMTGIELALEKSKPNSFLYAYTDASAYDHGLFERVKSLSLKKSTKVSFLLTGECSDGNSIVYDKLAVATSGQVFHIQKDDVNKIMDYIIDSVKHVKTTLGQKYMTNGSGKQIQFIVDSKVWDVIVSVSAANPRFHVIGSDGETIEPIKDKSIYTSGTKIEQFNVKPGVYTVVLDTNGPTSVAVTGSTLVTFVHGFSTFEPAYLSETSTKPIPDEESYLSIKLDNYNKDVLLNTVELQDLDDNTIATIPLKLINEDDQFYATKTSFLPPNKAFKIRVTGYTKEGEKIIRLGTTTIEPQNVKFEKAIENKIPSVTIVDGSEIDADYNGPLSIKCKVHAYPKPDVVWQDSTGTVWPSKVVPVDLPYDYISILNIDKVNKNSIFTCEAINTHGGDKASIRVELKTYINILERPVDTTIGYGDSFNFQVVVDAYPPATITWFKDSFPITVDENYNFSTENDTSILTVKNANFDQLGKYYAKVSNGYQEEEINFNVLIHAEYPKLNKTTRSLRFKYGSTAVIKCNVTRGYPVPKISWSFKYDDSSKPTKLDKVKDTIIINSVTKANTGIYTCTAFNELGRDSQDIDVVIEYPPTIDSEDEIVDADVGRKVKLVCLVDGAPSPSIKWFRNNVEIKSTSKHHIFKGNTLRFNAKLANHGAVYTCEATNILGKARKNFLMNIRSPAHIESPEVTKLSVDVGNPLTLTCKADGVPKPEVRWNFYRFPWAKPIALRADETNTIEIERTKFENEGIYICMANNSLEPVYLTYEVHVIAKPSIVNTLVDKSLKGVVGDLVLRIPCKAVGSPKPTITWTMNDRNIAIGTDWYDVDDEGTLIIKNLDKGAEGTYQCKAENELGFDTETFKVDVHEYPEPERSPTNTFLLEEGASYNFDCDLPHDIKDLVRWFKDGRFIGEGELHLPNTKLSDSGIYTCRVSNFMRSDSSHRKITVGRKPRFSTDEETEIEYNEGSGVLLGCAADSDTKLDIHWYHNGHELEESTEEMVLFMNSGDIGNYTCKVSNEFGQITRTFNINRQECVLNIENDFESKQPFFVTLRKQWHPFKPVGGLIIIPKGSGIMLSCLTSNITDKKNIFPETVRARCVEKSTFKIRGELVDYKDLFCLKENKPVAKNIGDSCGQVTENTKLVTVGFNIRTHFLGVYDVCVDVDNKVPVFAKHTMSPSFANVIPKDYMNANYSKSNHLPFEFDFMYDCENQMSAFISLRTSTTDSCCYKKTQLINPKDVLPGQSQLATYSYLNVVPHWSTCGTENWDEVDQRVRSLVQSLGESLEIWTGSSKPLKSFDMYSYLNDEHDTQPISPYIWKVLYNPKANEAVAIIQLNLADLTLSEAIKRVPCRDICGTMEWMRNPEWYNVNKGFTVCCKVDEFQSVFGFNFTKATRVLSQSFIPRYALALS